MKNRNLTITIYDEYNQILKMLNDAMYSRFSSKFVLENSYIFMLVDIQESLFENSMKEYLYKKLYNAFDIYFKIKNMDIPIWKLNNNFKRNKFYELQLNQISYMDNTREKFILLRKYFYHFLHEKHRIQALTKNSIFQRLLFCLYSFKIDKYYFTIDQIKFLIDVYCKFCSEDDTIKALKLLFNKEDAFCFVEK